MLGTGSITSLSVRRGLASLRAYADLTGAVYVLLCLLTMASVVTAAGAGALRFAVPALAFFPIVLGVFPGERALVARYERNR